MSCQAWIQHDGPLHPPERDRWLAGLPVLRRRARVGDESPMELSRSAEVHCCVGYSELPRLAHARTAQGHVAARGGRGHASA
jgi:hypothetical protein